MTSATSSWGSLDDSGSSSQMPNPHFRRTRIDATLCDATYVYRGRVLSSLRNAESARVAIPLPENSLPIQ